MSDTMERQPVASGPEIVVDDGELVAQFFMAYGSRYDGEIVAYKEYKQNHLAGLSPREALEEVHNARVVHENSHNEFQAELLKVLVNQL